MAKKQNKSQSTSTTETNLTPKGMIKDVDASYLSKQNWSHARNAINNSVEGDTGVIGNEPANLLCANIPYTVIGGIHLYGDIWAIFSTDNTNSEIGRFDDSRCEYETIVNDSCLSFNTDHLIVGASKENYNCQWQLYWDDKLNPSRTLNIDDIPYLPVVPIMDPCDVEYTTNLDCDAIRLAPFLDTPCIKVSKSEEGGSLVNGTYQAFIAYTLDNQVIGDYIGVSNLQSFWDHSGPSGSLDIQISNLDKDFDNYQLVIRYKTHNAIRSKIIGYYSTEQSIISIDYIDDRLETVPDITLVIRNPVFEKSDGMWVVNDYLIRSGPTEKFDFNYQPLANQIHTHWVSYRYPQTYYANGGNKPSFMRDEQYAFFIRWIYDTGDKSSAYHIPGRPAGMYDPGGGAVAEDGNLANASIGIGPAPEKFFEAYNTANEVAATPAVNTIVDERYSGQMAGEGHMGYWESTDYLLYPNDPIRWNSNTGNSAYDLCGQPIRHHKFPDETTTLLTTGSTCLSVNSGQFINVLGVKFENILPPVMDPHNAPGNVTLVPNISGYEILTGNRSGNKSIVAKGIIRNMFTYQRETASDGAPTGGTTYNEIQGPRQDGQPYGIFPNYPYNDLHYDPYLINRNQGQLVSQRPWMSGIEDNFLNGGDGSQHYSQDDKALGEITRDYFTFHSPDAMFSRMFLNPNEIKIYKTLRGTSIGNFKRSEEHPRFKLIKRRSVLIAAVVGVGYALNQMRGPENVAMTEVETDNTGQAGTYAVGTGAEFSSSPLSIWTSLVNAGIHILGLAGMALAKIGIDTVVDAATIVGQGRQTFEFTRPAYQAASSLAGGFVPGGGGAQKTTEFIGTDFTGVPSWMAIFTGIFAFLNYIATGGDKVLDLIRNLISYQDHVYKYISHGFYNDEQAHFALPWSLSTGNNIMASDFFGDSSWRREVEDARYIRQAMSAFPGNVEINNLKRQSTIVLHTIDTSGNGTTGPGGTVLDSTYGGLMDPNGNDFSKFVIGDAGCGEICMQDDGNYPVSWYSPGATTCKDIAVNYVGLKVNIDNQYGQIDNILMQPTGECEYVPTNTWAGTALPATHIVHFGGDVYINRYTEKTSMPFFWDFLKDGEDGMGWNYMIYPNVPFPRYWLDSNKFRMDEYVKPITDLSFDWRGHTPSDLYHLDGATNIDCDPGVPTFTFDPNIDTDAPPVATITASYDTTNEQLIDTFTTSGGAVPNPQTNTVTGWLDGAWTIPIDPTGVDCTCNPCASCASTTPCGPMCNQALNSFDNQASAYALIAAFTAPFDSTFIIFQGTTDNDPTSLGTAWTQTPGTPGTGGDTGGPGTSMPMASQTFVWHQNYSVIPVEGTLNLTVPIGVVVDEEINFSGQTDTITITHPDDPSDVRIVSGLVAGVYKRATMHSDLAASTPISVGILKDSDVITVDNTGSGGTPTYYQRDTSCTVGVSPQYNNFEQFKHLYDSAATPGTGTSDQPGGQTILQINGTMQNAALLYNWNTGVFERFVNRNYGWVTAYSINQTPVTIPVNTMIPEEDTSLLRIRHSGSSRSWWWPGPNCPTHVHNMSGGSAGTDNKGIFGWSPVGYTGQAYTDIEVNVSGGTPPPTAAEIGTMDPPVVEDDPGTDPDAAGGPFVVTDHYMYVHNNGVQDFFVESEINTAYRDYSDSIITRHYDYTDYTDIVTMFDALVQDVDNYYKYDKSLSQKRFWNTSFGEIQPRWYDPSVAENCLTHFPKRLIYSLPTGGASQKALKQQKKEANKDFWRIYLSKNYRDFKSTINTIKPINKTGALVLFPTISPQMFQGVDALKPTKGGTKLIIGDGGLFSQAFQNVANSDVSHEYGSCESARSVVNTPMGLFYISQAQGKIFQYGSKGINAISDLGMKWWFSKYLPSSLIAALPAVEDCPNLYDNPVTGIGTQTVYDPVNDIVYFMKKDYEVLSPCVGYVPCDGFLIDNDCLSGSGSGFGSTTVTYICAAGQTWDPVANACVEIIEEPCNTDPNDCPTGYQNVALCTVGSCRCCQDDSADGCCESNVDLFDNDGNVYKGCRCEYHHYPTNIIYPDQVPIDLDNTAFFNEISWTVSYDPKSKAWISFHDWHPELSFNSINHFLTTKEDGANVCPEGTVWDPDLEMCCEIVSFSTPRISQLLTMDIPGVATTVGSPACVDDNTIPGTCVGTDVMVLPCGQNAASGYQFTVCAGITCNCDGNGTLNGPLIGFRNSCEGSNTFFDSWDDGTPCATEQEIWDYEHEPDGTPNGLTYVDPGFCEATCSTCMDPEIGTSIWRHNTRTDLFANYYGIDYPWEVDIIEHTGQAVSTIRSLEYQLESYVYKNDGRDRFHDLDWNFDESIIYNTEQVSGLLRLNITPKNNPVLTSTFPIISGGFIDILYSKEEQKYRFNQFWDITADRGEFNPGVQQTIFNTQMDGYIRNLNAANLNYAKAQTQRKKFRHYYNHILLRRVKSEDRKMLFRLGNTKLNISMK